VYIAKLPKNEDGYDGADNGASKTRVRDPSGGLLLGLGLIEQFLNFWIHPKSLRSGCSKGSKKSAKICRQFLETR
jgi:hypothetical protein